MVDGQVMIFYVERAVFFVLALVALGLELWALVDCARHRANAFEATGKRTKSFWLALTGGATVVGLISLFASGGACSAPWACSAWQPSWQPRSTSPMCGRQ